MNPFDVLKEEATGEQWGGHFLCATRFCNLAAYIADYDRKKKTLEYECPEGHITTLKGIEDE